MRYLIPHYINFMIEKVARDMEKKYSEWRVEDLERYAIPHTIHELKTIKELGLEFVSVENRLEGLKREYKSLTGREYQH